MPKIVGHDERRERIIEAVWEMLVREGFASLTMRGLAQEVGMANGALARYFPTKGAILRAAYQRAFDATNERAAEAIGDLEGMRAFRRLCIEIMPLDETRLDEARVAIGFWDYAAVDTDLMEVHAKMVAQWRRQLEGHLRSALAAGEIDHAISPVGVVDHVMSVLMGLQINAVLSPDDNDPSRQLSILDAVLEPLAVVPRDVVNG